MAFTEPVRHEILVRWEGLAHIHQWDDEKQRKTFIDYPNHYRYPLYRDLVGPPQPHHYESNGDLTIERKAQLLLIGVFNWNGWYIATTDQAQPGKGQAGWYAVNEYDPDTPIYLFDLKRRKPIEAIAVTRGGQRYAWSVENIRGQPRKPWRPEVKFWWNGKMHDYPNLVGGGSTPKLMHNGYFDPAGQLAQGTTAEPVRLETVLLPPAKNQKVQLKFPNPFDLRPENLMLTPKSGRPSKCKGCGRHVPQSESNIIRIGNEQFRFCEPCITRMAQRDDYTLKQLLQARRDTFVD